MICINTLFIRMLITIFVGAIVMIGLVYFFSWRSLQTNRRSLLNYGKGPIYNAFLLPVLMFETNNNKKVNNNNNVKESPVQLENLKKPKEGSLVDETEEQRLAREKERQEAIKKWHIIFFKARLKGYFLVLLFFLAVLGVLSGGLYLLVYFLKWLLSWFFFLRT